MSSTKTDSGASYKLKMAMKSMGLSENTTTKQLWGKKPLRNQAPITTDQSLIGMEIPSTPAPRIDRHIGDRLTGQFEYEAAPERYEVKPLSLAGQLVKAANADRDLAWDAAGCPDPRGRFDSADRQIKEGNVFRAGDITEYQNRRDNLSHHKRHDFYPADSYSKESGGKTISVYDKSVIDNRPVKVVLKKVEGE